MLLWIIDLVAHVTSIIKPFGIYFALIEVAFTVFLLKMQDCCHLLAFWRALANPAIPHCSGLPRATWQPHKLQNRALAHRHGTWLCRRCALDAVPLIINIIDSLAVPLKHSRHTKSALLFTHQWCCHSHRQTLSLFLSASWHIMWHYMHGTGSCRHPLRLCSLSAWSISIWNIIYLSPWYHMEVLWGIVAYAWVCSLPLGPHNTPAPMSVWQCRLWLCMLS